MEQRDWQQLYDKFYRKREIYSMLWKEMDLTKYVIAGSSFGGPIAMVRDEKKLLLLNEQSIKSQLRIYSSAGDILAAVLWDRKGLIRMAWSALEELVCAMEDGNVLFFSVQGHLLRQFSMGSRCAEVGVIDAQIWPTGVVVLTSDNQLVAVENFDEPRPINLADLKLSEPPLTFVVIEPRFSLSKKVEVIVATASGSVLSVDADSVQDQLLDSGPFLKFSLAPEGRFIACFSQEGNLIVYSSDFQKTITQFATKSRLAPQQLVWCGTDSILLYWDKILLMVGPQEDWIKYSYDDPAFLLPECDGVRIITQSKCEFLQRVPNVTEDVFKIGSTKPGAMLFDAYKHFEEGSVKADENLRCLRANNELAEAVDVCIEAATYELDTQQQKQLLSAASYGKSFLEFYDTQTWIDNCRMIRVLDAVGDFNIGLPITAAQYLRQGPEQLIKRLTNLHHHALAFKICENLKLDREKERVLVNWACEKVKSDQIDDTHICDAIINRLKLVEGVSCAEIASTAYKVGRKELATMLLESEPRAADQVPLLMSMQQDPLALQKAIESGDTDLVFDVLLTLKNKHSLQDFFHIIKDNPVAVALFVSYSREKDPELLKTYYYQANLPQESAHIAVMESYKTPDLQLRLDNMRTAVTFYRDNKQFEFYASTMEDQARLYQIQYELGKEYVGKSLADTLNGTIELKDHKRAAKIKNDFKLSEKRWYWAWVKTLGRLKDWEELEKFVKDKKETPIGWEPFIRVAIDGDAKLVAIHYINKLKDPLTKVKYFVEMGQLRDAGEVAFAAKDIETLRELQAKCTSPTVKVQLDQWIRLLSK